MIVANIPRPGHAWRSILRPFLLLLAWDLLVTVAYYNEATHFDGIAIQYSLFGTVIALFIGFMVNAAYARWWEARTLWGGVVNASRNLGRQAVTLLDEDAPGGRRGLVAEVIHAEVTYVHVLRSALRGQQLPDEAAGYLERDAYTIMESARNRQTAVLTGIGSLLTEARRRGMLGDIARAQMDSTLSALTDAQGGLERIRSTPLPVQYRFLPSFFARLFCLILPFTVVDDLGVLTPVGSGLVGLMFLLAVQVGFDLAEPFSDDVYDVPMTALCRSIEIDLLQMLGRTPPEPVTPVDKVLW